MVKYPEFLFAYAVFNKLTRSMTLRCKALTNALRTSSLLLDGKVEQQTTGMCTQGIYIIAVY